ncbi:unnamed protein product [marine sediment metagenome]|uniref:PIN domain-containing protein n=1 Tax=marine sediment metagenome TaxID=412755 RepID=X0ZWK6_9ZZZZ
MMNIIYFDTNVYNEILEKANSHLSEEIKKFCNDNNYEIAFSYVNWEEFCNISDKQKEKRISIFKLAYSICKHKFLLEPVSLLKKEFKYYKEEKEFTKEDIFDQENDLNYFFTKVLNGDLSLEESKQCLEERKNNRKEFKNSEKEIIRKFKKYVNNKKELHNNFHIFFPKKEILAKHWIELIANSKFKEEDFIQADLSKLPSHQIYYTFRSALCYIQTIEHTKINRGNIQDMRHSIYIPYCDIFVTNDKNLLRIIKLLKEKVNLINDNKCVSFEYFKENYICRNY